MNEPNFPSAGDIARVVHHIQETWSDLTRGLRNAPQAVCDVKLGEEHKYGSPIYISPAEDIARVQRIFEKSLGGDVASELRLKVLPPDASRIQEHGLLFLPGRYLVPGGRF